MSKTGKLAIAVSVVLLAFFSTLMCPLFIKKVKAVSAYGKYEDLLYNYIPVIREDRVTSGDMEFIHPGIGLTKDMIGTMVRHVRAGDEPWATAFADFASLAKSSYNPVMNVLDHLDDCMDITSADIADRYMCTDMDTAYAQSIMYVITGNEVYRRNCMTLIRIWGQIRSSKGMSNQQIYFGVSAFKYAFAAEMMRYSDCRSAELIWSDEDTLLVRNYLEVTYDRYNFHEKWMSHHTMAVLGLISGAVFNNDVKDYRIAIQRITSNPESEGYAAAYSGGDILHLLREMTVNDLTGVPLEEPVIQHVEMGSEMGSAYNSLGGISNIAWISLAQGTLVNPDTGYMTKNTDRGVNLFEYLNNRILDAANLLAKCMLGYEIPYVPVKVGISDIYTGINRDRPTGWASNCLGSIYIYYKFIAEKKDMDTAEDSKYLSQIFYRNFPEGADLYFFGNSVLLFTPESALEAGYADSLLKNGKKHNITVEHIGNGSIICYAKKMVFGDIVTIFIDPQEGHELVNLTVNGVKVWVNPGDNTVSVSMPNKDVVIRGEFRKITRQPVKVVLEGYEAGANRITGAGEYEPGDTVTVTVDIPAAYRFIGWFVDGAEVTEGIFSKGRIHTYTFTMEKGITITAKVTANKATFVDANDLVNTVYIVNGEVEAIKAVGLEGHEFLGWSMDGGYTLYKAGDVIQVTDSVVLYAVYTKDNNSSRNETQEKEAVASEPEEQGGSANRILTIAIIVIIALFVIGDLLIILSYRRKKEL